MPGRNGKSSRLRRDSGLAGAAVNDCSFLIVMSRESTCRGRLGHDSPARLRNLKTAEKVRPKKAHVPPASRVR